MSCTGVNGAFVGTTPQQTVTVQPGATLTPGLGTALSMSGANPTLVNNGTVDPSLLGVLSVLATGAVVGNSSANTVGITNTGTIRGTTGLLGLNLADLTGLALVAQNGTGGTTTINNSGTLGSAALLGITLIPNDAAVAASYGGARTDFTNTGTINGRVALQAPTSGPGNTFVNGGTINGSVSMGAGTTNTFTAQTGSSVNTAPGASLNVLGIAGLSLGFAVPGIVDGGAGGNNTLLLTQAGGGPTAGTINTSNYINFQHLGLNSGTWTLNGASTVLDTTLLGGSTAIFNDGGAFGTGTITSTGGTIQAGTAGLTVGNAVTLGTGGLTVQGANGTTLSGVMSGTAGLTKNGTGTLTLSGADTYTGGTSINAGTLALGAGGSLAPAGAVTLTGAGAGFNIAGASGPQTIGGLNGVTGSLIGLGANTLTFGDANNGAFGGTISGTGGIVKNGAGTETLTGANTYTGGTTINAGGIALGATGSLAPTGAIDLAGTGASLDLTNATGAQTIGALSGVGGTSVLLGANPLTLGDATNATFGGTISGTAGIVKNGTGTETLTGANTFTGGTNVNAGTLAIGAGGSLAATGALTLGSNTGFDISGASGPQTVAALNGAAGSVIGLGNNTLAFGDAANGTFAGTINGAGGIVKNGAGTETLTAANTFTGGTAINAGTLALGAGGSLSPTGIVNLVNAGAALDVSGATTAPAIGSLAGAAGTNVTLGANTLQLGDANDATFGGTISGTGGLVKTGTGTETLTGANTFTGGATINDGTLALGAGGSLTPTTSVTLTGPGAGFDIGGASGPQTIGALNGVSGSVVGLGNNTLAFGTAANGTFAGAIDGAGGIVKNGAGTETLTGANTFTGGTTVNAGTIAVGAGGSLAPTGAVNLANAGTAFDVSGAGAPLTIGALSGVGGSSVALGGNTLGFGDAGNATFNGTIGGTGGIVKLGTGTETLTAAQTFTGGTNINAGRLVLASAGDLAPGSGVNLSGTGAELDLSGANGARTIGALSGVGGTAVTLGNNALTLGDANSTTFGGAINGAGGVTKNGSGTLTLTGGNTFNGGTTVNAGTVAVGAGGSLASTGAVNLANAGTALDVSGADTPQTIGALSGVGGTSIALGDNTLAFGDANNTTFGGTIGGTGGIVKQGSGTQTLTAAQTFTGNTTINAGTLALGAGGSLDSASVVDIGQPGAVLDVSGASTNPTLGGLSGVAGGSVLLGSHSLFLAVNGDSVYGGTISGTGGIVKTGAGTQTLDGANTFTGGTSLAGGTLVLGNAGALGSGGLTVDAPSTLDTSTALTIGNAVTLNTGATFGGSNDLTLTSPVTGGGGITKDGAANLTLAGNNNYSGGTTLNSGTITANTGTALGSGTVTLNGGALNTGTTQVAISTLNGVSGSAVNVGTGGIAVGGGDYGGTIGGAGGVTKTSPGTLTLTGENTYTGGTTINSGTLQVGNGGTSGSITGPINNNGSLVFNSSDNVTYGGSISGSGTVTKVGDGTLSLTGTNTSTGPVAVGGGTLDVSGAMPAAPVTVGSGGTVSGSGTIGSVVVHNGGTAAATTPGQALNVAGNVTFEPGSNYNVGANPQQQSGQILAGGTTQIQGGTVNVQAGGGKWGLDNNYTILTSQGGVNGTFTNATSNLVFLTPTLGYDANNVYLSLVPNGVLFPSIAATPNQRAAATAIAQLGVGNPVFNAIFLSDAPSARWGFATLAGEIYASTRSMLVDDSRLLRDAVTDRLRRGFSVEDGPLAALSSSQGAMCDDTSTSAGGTTHRGSSAACAERAPWRPTVWAQGYGAHDRLNGSNGVSDVTQTTSGFFAGVDTAVNDHWRVGAAAGFGHGSISDDLNASASVDSYHLALYGGAQYGPLGVRMGGGYSWNHADTDRTIGFSGFNAKESSGETTKIGQVFGEVGYGFAAGPVAVEPFAALAYVNVSSDGFEESGPAALKGDSDNQGITYSTLGARAAWRFYPGAHGMLTARAMAGWRHAMGDTTPVSRVAFVAGGSGFDVTGVPIARDAAVVELGVDAAITKNLSFGVQYSGQYGGGAQDHTLTGNLQWKF
ncbi:autotransporter-associated beta strand repeat-containing protein [Caballeronia sp. LZ065]|uniref:autotransporter-associated beta strand repeat-containing protein n=1 Tax=Caballeronia sp. LZ065 TaxID=3038571 RepID=UPI002866D4CC|nr:autotransporter-associated beta strand repeat-containing protein [Caballeronia sp. LZ065]MDR5781954.1 autotransporter-associated beta strand repeat-containing protein [Caballeronia sp. LZ065]